jgi:hypothetical protein
MDSDLITETGRALLATPRASGQIPPMANHALATRAGSRVSSFFFLLLVFFVRWKTAASLFGIYGILRAGNTPVFFKIHRKYACFLQIAENMGKPEKSVKGYNGLKRAGFGLKVGLKLA